MIEIMITPLGVKSPGRFEVRHGDRLILKASRQPLLDAARVFLAEGVPPETRIAMRHEGSPHVALSSSVGAAAKLTVKETTSDGAPRFRRWEAFDGGVGVRVRSPSKIAGDPLSDSPDTEWRSPRDAPSAGG